MSHRTFQIWQRVSSGALLSGLVMSSSILNAQESVSSRVKDFRWPEYYDPPHQNQMKSLLAGAEAQPQANGKFLIKELKLEMYRENGEREVVVEAPECVYDSAQRVARSAGRLQVQTGDGRFLIEGEGFLWQQTNSSLIISNRAHTIVRPGPRKAGPPKS
jgi:hypothetical protein